MLLFVCFFPQSYNKKYPLEVTDKNANLFADLVPGEWPKQEELNVIHQLFDNETIGLFHNHNKSIIHQNLLITKRL